MLPEKQTHPFPPLFDAASEVLILGSFPSVKSRQQCFYYGHPQNRFWRVMAELLKSPVPVSVEEKRSLMLLNHIALWDSIAACTITGSSDSSIRDVIPNDMGFILSSAPIRNICCNGRAAFDCYNKYILPKTGREARQLPSTSPANAAWSMERLVRAWGETLFK